MNKTKNNMNKKLKMELLNIWKKSGLKKYFSMHEYVLILTYHKVNNFYDMSNLSVDEEIFNMQMMFCKENFDVINMDYAVSLIQSGNVDRRYCVVTFDDGYRDNYDVAVPLLAEHGLPATLFVTCDAIESGRFGWGEFDRAILGFHEDSLDLSKWKLGAYSLRSVGEREKALVALHSLLKKCPNSLKVEVFNYVSSICSQRYSSPRYMMNWNEILSISKSDLFTIGAHTVTHPILSKISCDDASFEIMNSKSILEDKIGKPVDFFAYPNGRVEDIGDFAQSIVAASGYKAACTMNQGLNDSNADVFALKRINVDMEMSVDADGKFSPDLFDFYLSGFLQRCLKWKE